MKRAVYLSAISGFLLTAFSASAQSKATTPSVHGAGEPIASSSPAVAASTPITTRLSSIVFDEPATEEGFATVRIADEAGEAVYRGMMPVAVGTRSLDLSAVRIPAAGRYSVRVIYPGGTVVQEIETAYTAAASAVTNKLVAGW